MTAEMSEHGAPGAHPGQSAQAASVERRSELDLENPAETRFVKVGQDFVDPEQMEAILADQREAAERLETMLKRLTDLSDAVRGLSHAQDEARRVDEVHWRQHIIEPMVRQLFPIFDFALRFSNGVQPGAEKTKEVFGAMRTMLGDFFQAYDVEPFVPSRNAPFDAKSMKAIAMENTQSSTMNRRVRSCRQAGFSWRQDYILRPASVVLWRHESINRPQSGPERGGN